MTNLMLHVDRIHPQSSVVSLKTDTMGYSNSSIRSPRQSADHSVSLHSQKRTSPPLQVSVSQDRFVIVIKFIVTHNP
jgi:hypothetical protein